MLMCICMLIRRTNVLFSKEDYRLLSSLAVKKGVSMGELIRKAIRKVYQADQEIEEKSQLVNSLTSLWKKQKGTINYKRLVEDGRRI